MGGSITSNDTKTSTFITASLKLRPLGRRKNVNEPTQNRYVVKISSTTPSLLRSAIVLILDLLVSVAGFSRAW